MKKIKVMIVDDHLVVREGLRQLLEIEDDVKVVAEASNGLKCLELIDVCGPDIVFMDIKMPGISGIEATRLIRQKHDDVKVIMLTIHDEDQLVADSIHAGANGYVMKNAFQEDLITAIHSVMKGHAFLDPAVTSTVLDQIKVEKTTVHPGGIKSLTKRELEVLQAIVSGLMDKEIAELLCISEYTVKSHIKSVYRKLSVSSRSQAAVKAMKLGIIEQPVS